MPPSKSPAVRSLMRTAGVCALAAVSLCMWGAAAAVADSGLEVVGGTEGQKVELQACPANAAESSASPSACCAKKAAHRYLGGQLTLLVRDDKTTATLEVSYLPHDGTKPVALTGDSEHVFLVEEVGPLTPSSSESTPVAIGFALAPGEPASAIDGSLILKVASEKPLVVPISGEIRSFKGLSVLPSTLPMDSDHDRAKVTLVGPDVVAYLRSHGSETPTAILYGDGSDTSEAKLELPSAAEIASSDHPNRATATVKLTNADPTAGKYTGKLALSSLSTEAPTVEVELHSHRSYWLLVGLALLGVIAGGILTRLVTTAMRRRLLSDVLDQSYTAYRYVLGLGFETDSWRLEDLLAENPVEGGPNPPPSASRLQGLPALKESIASARSSGDLDEDATRVLDMIARMQRWLRVEPVARRLAIVSERKPDADPAGHDWLKSNTLRDTRALLEMVQREPADADKADELVSHLLFQLKWHNEMAVIWNAAASNGPLATEVTTLDQALGDESKAGTRTAEEQDGLEARLQALIPAGTAIPALPAVPGEPAGELPNGITPVRWNASANLFTGWATLDAQSYGQLTRRAATSARALYMPSPSDLAHEVTLLRLPDAGWTLVALTVASIAYGNTAYSNTWGTSQDLATAFLAGALGKVVVNWAALPIFQSIRLRAGKTASEAE